MVYLGTSFLNTQKMLYELYMLLVVVYLTPVKLQRVESKSGYKIIINQKHS